LAAPAHHSPVAALLACGSLARFGYLAIKLVHGIEWLWHCFHKPVPQDPQAPAHRIDLEDIVPISRRTFSAPQRRGGRSAVFGVD